MEINLIAPRRDFHELAARNFFAQRNHSDEEAVKVEESEHEDFEKIERIIRESTMFV